MAFLPKQLSGLIEKDISEPDEAPQWIQAAGLHLFSLSLSPWSYKALT